MISSNNPYKSWDYFQKEGKVNPGGMYKEWTNIVIWPSIRDRDGDIAEWPYLLDLTGKTSLPEYEQGLNVNN